MLELFSGVGGYHSALQIIGGKLSKHKLKVIGAVDINTVSNEVYRHNHPDTPCLQRNITGLTPEYLGSLAPDVICMSPPCQPHTRQGKQLDRKDPRSSPLDHLMTVLPQVETVKYLILENVCGFEKSEARDLVISTLTEAGFSLQEFLVCPRQLGIPNSRLRYYLLAKKDKVWSFSTSSKIMKDFCNLEDNIKSFGLDTEPKALETYLTESIEDCYLVPDKVLIKHAKVLDIIRPDSALSCCFTSGYFRYCEGTGSVIQSSGSKEDLDEAFRLFSKSGDEAELALLKLRYFTPQEISSLLGFPPCFSFPDTVTNKQRFKVLGNSLNVTVVSLLLFSLLT